MEMSKAPIVRPAIAGPTIRAVLKTAEFSATALATSLRPTISTTNDWRVGMSTALVIPSSSARTMICQTSTRPVAVSPNRTNARIICTTCVTIRVGRLGSASAMRPPNRPRTMTGRNCIAATRPRRNGSPVSCSTSHAWATVCIQVPTSEMSWPVKNRR